MKINEFHDMTDKEILPKPDYNIAEDLMIFMRNDPMFYRRSYFPTLEDYKVQKKTDLLSDMVKNGLNKYCEKFGLPHNKEDLLGDGEISQMVSEIIKDELDATSSNQSTVSEGFLGNLVGDVRNAFKPGIAVTPKLVQAMEVAAAKVQAGEALTPREQKMFDTFMSTTLEREINKFAKKAGFTEEMDAITAYKQSFIKKTPPESWLPDEKYREQLDNAIKKYGNNAKKLVAYIRSDNDFMLWFAKLPERDYLKKDAMAIIRPPVSETATAGSTSSGNMATVANPISANAKIKRDKNGVPMAPQKKNADGTAKNALELGNNLMGGATVKR